MQALNEFVLGILLAERWSQKKTAKFCCYPSLIFLLSGLILFLLLREVDEFRDQYLRFGFIVLFWPLADIFLYLFIDSALSLPKGIIRAILTNWPLQLIGMMCFSIYVWHMPLMGQLGKFAQSSNKKDLAEFFLVSFVVIVLFSAISYKYIEFPQKSWKKLFLPIDTDNNFLLKSVGMYKKLISVLIYLSFNIYNYIRNSSIKSKA